MGPRRISRGNWLSVANIDTVARLQWGRGGSAAETEDPFCIPVHLVRLQWGRGGSAAETLS